MKRHKSLPRIAAVLVATATAAISGVSLAQDAPGLTQPEEAKIALGREIVELGFPPASREAMFGSVVDTMAAQMNQASASQLADADPEVAALVMERQGEMIVELKQIIARYIPSLMAGMALAYADEFTLGELSEIRDFVATPAGSAFLLKSPNLLANPHYAAAMQPYLAEVSQTAQEWQKRMVEELQAREETQAESPS